MINKEKFCDIIVHIGLLQEQSERINFILRDPLYENVANDFVSAYAFNNPNIEQDLIDVLENMFNDTNHWISYYVYELECGRIEESKTMINKNGKDIFLRSAADLYDFIVYEDTDNFVGGTD